MKPELPGADTCSENVLDHLIHLVRGDNDPGEEDLFFQSVCCPTAVSNGQHKKVLHFPGAQDFHKGFHGSQVMEPKKMER